MEVKVSRNSTEETRERNLQRNRALTGTRPDLGLIIYTMSSPALPSCLTIRSLSYKCKQELQQDI